MTGSAIESRITSGLAGAQPGASMESGTMAPAESQRDTLLSHAMTWSVQLGPVPQPRRRPTGRGTAAGRAGARSSFNVRDRAFIKSRPEYLTEQMRGPSIRGGEAGGSLVQGKIGMS